MWISIWIDCRGRFNINIKEEQLKNTLKTLLTKDEFKLHQNLVQRISDELNISILDCAAALSLLNHPDLGRGDNNQGNAKIEKSSSDVIAQKNKVVRYRLDVGRKHEVSVEKIKQVLIEVSGVDKNRIGRLDVRNYYSLVDLPEGMPADIFQLLAEMEINQRKLNIKRVKFQPRFYRRKNRNKS